jgi:hypothetical protein
LDFQNGIWSHFFTCGGRAPNIVFLARFATEYGISLDWLGASPSPKAAQQRPARQKADVMCDIAQMIAADHPVSAALAAIPHDALAN